MGLIGEVERLNNTFLSEKRLKQKEKEDKQQTQAALFNYFYKQFKKKPLDYENIYLNLLFVNKREKIIEQLTQNNTASIQYINSIYTKTLKEVYNIFKNNYKYIKKEFTENAAPPKEDEPPKKQLDWAYFWQVIGIILLFPILIICGSACTYGKRKRAFRQF